VSTRPLLTADPRVILGKKVSRLRREGILPAVVFGHGHPSQAIQLDARTFDLMRRSVARNALVDLQVGEGKPTPVLLQHVAEHPVERHAVHVDFFIVRMGEELTVDVPVAVAGEAPAVARMGGTLLHMRDTVQVRALPGDLPSALELDISSLDSFDATLHVRDLVVPPKVTLLTDGEEVIAKVQAPRIEAEPQLGAEAAAEEPAEAAAPGAEGTASDEATAEEGGAS
jgi:large subunit ribosomal protein L25